METTTDRISVLHVDDDPEFTDLTAAFLARENPRLDVTTVNDAADVPSVLKVEDVDCIVSDHDMPGTTGIELLETIRSTYPELPFILFTGKGSEEIASEAITAGVTDYLQKSSGTDQYALLANRITNAVDRYWSGEELQDRKRYLETLISNLPGIVYRCRNSPNWEMIDVEGECEALVGYSAASLERDDVTWGTDIVHPADRNELWNEAQGRLGDGEPFEITYRILTASGETKWVWERGRAIRDEGCEILEGFITDVTDRKERERRIEELHSSTRQLLDADTDDDVAVAVATAANRTLGYANNVVRLHSDSRLLPVCSVSEELPDDVDRRPVYDVGEAPAGEAFERGEPVVRGDLDALNDGYDRHGTRSGMYLPIGDHGVLAVSETDVDVFDEDDVKLASILAANAASALDRVEHANRLQRQASELERYERIVETMADPVFELDSDGYVQFVNGAFTELTGYEPETIIGEHASFVISEEDVLKAEQKIRGLLDGDDSRIGVFEGTIHTADGQRRRCEVRQTLLWDGDELRGTVGTIRDVTDRKERERQLEAFAEVVSHDLRNPLGVANGYLQLIDTECETDYVADVRSAHERMETLIDDLLALAQKGEAIGETELVRLADLGRRCWRNVETNDGTLEIDTDAEVRADPRRLQQLLENLIRNAIEHGSPECGGITVTIGRTEGGFFVADDGDGIDADEMARAFETGHSTSETGTGLGLSIVRRIADAHGWSVSLVDGDAGGLRVEITGVEVGS